MKYDLYYGVACVDFKNYTHEIFWESFDGEDEIKKILLNPPPFLRRHHALIIAREQTPEAQCAMFSIVDTHGNEIERARKDILFFDGENLRSVKKPDRRVEWDVAGFLEPRELDPKWYRTCSVKDFYYKLYLSDSIPLLGRLRGKQFLVDQFVCMVSAPGFATPQYVRETVRVAQGGQHTTNDSLRSFEKYMQTSEPYQLVSAVSKFLEHTTPDPDVRILLRKKFFIDPLRLADFLILCYSKSQLTDPVKEIK